jgi:transcriptional regulator with XRE-family HTH domain
LFRTEQAHGRVAFLPFAPLQLKGLKLKETDFEPKTLGQHVRRCRLTRGLTQNQAAHRLRVNAWTVLNWEKGKTEPPIESVPAILDFLGYDPTPEPRSLPEHMFANRRRMGWSIKAAARELGVDEETWGAWESGETIVFRKHRELVAQLLGLPVDKLHYEMRDRWNRSHSNTPINHTSWPGGQHSGH